MLPPRIPNQSLTLDGLRYKLWVKKQVESSADAVKIVIASYQPDRQNSDLVRLCLECLRRFTVVDHEIWVVDSCSPWENLKWLLGYPEINLAFSRTKPRERGSYDNATRLEIAKELFDQQTKYLMTLHQDTVVTKNGWLKYLLSKFFDTIKAVGVREDRPHVYNSWHWVNSVMVGRHFGMMMKDRYLEVKYEDLCLNFEATVKQVLGFLGYSVDKSVIDDLLPKVRTKSVGKHKAMPQEWQDEVMQIIKPHLLSFGYEL